MHWETSGGRHKVYVVNLDGAPRYRHFMASISPNGTRKDYWQGDYPTIGELLASRMARFDLADLEPVDD